MNTATDVKTALRAAVDHEPRIFKAGPGEYAEGDKFLGITVPNTRIVAKQFKDLLLPEVEKLLQSKWHDERLCALFILVGQFRQSPQTIYNFYMAHTKWVNNWDLVDSSAYYIVGPYLYGRPEALAVLAKLASSDSLWERRIAMVATLAFSRKGSTNETLVVAEQLLHDKHDLIHKAVGWMLREMSKKCGTKPLLQFLDKYAATMPRTALRYAVEHLPLEQKVHYMHLRQK